MRGALEPDRLQPLERIYSLLLYLALPLALLRLAWRGRRAPAYRQRWRERLGLYGERPLRADFWVHAVSVGEVQAARSLVEPLLERHPRAGVMVTTTTPTGSEQLRGLFGDRVRHVYSPFDLAPILGRFLDAVRPRIAVVMETEIWPNMLRACARRDIPVVLANARLSARSARGYARLGGFTRQTLRRFTAVCAQDRADAARFRALGAPPERVRVTGSIKFEAPPRNGLLAPAQGLRGLWDRGRPVWVAASTHQGEEEQVLAAHREILESLPQTLLVLVPRHPERFEPVASLIARAGFAMTRRTQGHPCGRQTSVFLGDTMGELPAFLAAADAAFVGGSLVPTGGHNLLEAAAVGVPVAVGPHVFNFARITDLMVRAGAAIRVADARELAQCIRQWLTDAGARTRAGEQGRRVVERNRGARERLLALLEELYASAR